MKGVTKRQREIIDFIEEFISLNRYSPSYREIGQRFGLSSLGTVYKHIQALKRKGLIDPSTHVSRALVPTNFHSEQKLETQTEIPFIGSIAAGVPIQTFPQTQSISVPQALVHSPNKTYALRAQGDSLHEEMIADGDILLVEARQHAHPGETVVALINSYDIIVKKYYPQGTFIHLLGVHIQKHPIILRSEDIVVQGILVGLLRQLG